MKIYNFVSIFIGSSFILNIYAHIACAEQSKTKQLSDIKQSIRKKQIEKEKLILQENIFKKEFKVINNTIIQTEKKLEEVSENIESASKNFKKSAKEYNDASLRKSSWHKTAIEELNLFHKMIFSKSYNREPLEYKLRILSLKYCQNNFEKEKKSAKDLASRMKKWGDSKKNLILLKQKENEVVARNKNLLEEKNRNLKTIVDKRRNAEKAIKDLNDTAKALQKLINKINSENIKKKETRVGPSQSRIKRKKFLPWPVEGKVISNFGKIKHPELDTYILNNGIKINASNYAKIKSIDSGKVVFTGTFRSYGQVIIIDHRNSTFSVYGLLNKTYVKEGQKVSKEAVIADIGSGKDAVLYFEIRQNNIPDNPILWLK
ncbi:MAG: peptidoglycan DD-metalloendopeptidase family protein [Endomicrobium sp.]|jgi:septal ring factor EnvC (AmiA/AmiB activator)|nr:peptidoglycan DD-metalloendopeptidase family protein [Endomicrobium sp.]